MARSEDRSGAHAEQECECGGTERPLSKDIEDEAPYEGPDEARLESDRHGDDDPDDEHEVRLSYPEPQVWPHGQFQQGRHRRTERGQQQCHRARRSSVDWPKVAPRPHGPSGIGRTAATSREVSHGRGLPATEIRLPFVLYRPSTLVPGLKPCFT